ncbi:hypothetical protein EDB82DRAFT_347583 [Fusarium venenatum]|uniref:uncharacterized protein n=1 Tax=Fusarium venenatum TaxID=56646 RepID=UPI001D613977|nr:hypothetical protein EDB82DRAFT_347583 [Fusarium venenatum]
MPSFNLLNIFCCRKSRWDGSGSPEPATQDKTALHPVLALDPPLEEQQEQHETKRQNTAMGLSNMAWAVPEYRSSFESDSITSQHIDSDSDSLNSDLDLPRSTKPGTAFGAVRNRYIRSISHNTSSDHPSRVSVSNSEEEVARRAELRWIMRLRIQDQLESDEAEDQSENKPTVSIYRVASSANSALPISRPRDAIEFGVNNSSSSNGQPARLNRERGNHGTPQDFGGSHGCATAPERDPSEEPDMAGRNNDSSENAVIQRPLPIHPSAHISLTDVELSPSQKSFLLSNGSGRLDRILGPESSFNNRQASSGDGQSALGVWLIAQGLRSRDNSTLSFDEEEEKEEAQTRKLNKKATDNTPAVSREKNSLVHGTHAMSEKGDCHEQGSTFTSSPKKLDPQCLLESGTLKDFCDNSAFSGELPWGSTVRALLNSFTDDTSSSDPSKSPSSPVRPPNNLYKLDLKELESMELSPFRWRSRDSPQDQSNLDNQNCRPPHHLKSHSQAFIGNVQYEAETMHGAASVAQSDSASFVQREAGLKTIKRRFSEALDQKSTEKTVSTCFHEDFSHFDTRSPAKKPPTNNTCLAIPVSHFRAKSEGALYQHGEDHQDVPRAQMSPLVPAEKTKVHEKEASDRSKRRSNMSIRPYMSRLPTEEYRKQNLERQESATDLWQLAIRLEAESRHSSSFLNTPNHDQRSLSSNRSLKRTGAARNSNNSISDVRREISQLTPSTNEQSSPNNSKWLIERWVSQMRPRPAHPTESVASVGLVDPPRSWSKFPSFNRGERNRNITSRDKVHPRDFAVKHVTSEGQIRWATDTGSGRDGQRAHKLPRSLSTRFGGLVKSKMSRMMPPKGLRHWVSQAFIARSMTTSPPHMEYPEMGIRPSDSGYTEIQAMGREINYMKGRAHLQTLEKDLSKPHSSRSLGDRVVALMHETIGQRHPKHDDPLQSPDIPMIPVTPSLFRQSIAATATDVFVTPKSRLSNDDESDEEKGETGRDLTK